MSKRMKKDHSFVKAVALLKRHKVSFAALVIFFIGFVATGLAYAMITGELKYFGTTVWVSRVNVDIIDTSLGPGAGVRDSVNVSPDSKTITFYLQFTEINAPKYVNFCLRNNGSHTVQFNTPTISSPTDPNVHVDWPNLDGLTMAPGDTLCGADTRVTVYYTDMPIGSPYYATMSMSISYDQI